MENSKFLEVIDLTPLVSIDIILKNARGDVLLGKRNNRPAKDFWFVPGGRIKKNETLKQALSRISIAELGFELHLHQTSLIGAFDHIYADNTFGEDGINTHYVALGHQAELAEGQKVEFDTQHSAMKWWAISELMEHSDVHENTKTYFKSLA